MEVQHEAIRSKINNEKEPYASSVCFHKSHFSGARQTREGLGAFCV